MTFRYGSIIVFMLFDFGNSVCYNITQNRAEVLKILLTF